MHVRNVLSSRNVNPVPRYSRGEPARSGRSFHLVAALMLLIGLIAPFATLGTVNAAPGPLNRLPSSNLQQRDDTPPPLQGVFAVSIGGDVGDIVGQIPLQPVGEGIWTGLAALGPGSYGYQVIVSTNAGDITLGEDGLESPPADQAIVNVPDGAPSAIFTFNENTGEIQAGGLVFEISTDVGQFQLAPDGEGNFEVYFSSPPGQQITIEPIAFGTPTGEVAQGAAGDSGRVHVVMNADGQMIVVEPVQTATLTVIKVDQDGNALPGSCFTAYGRRDAVESQACDETDGNLDGVTFLQFPNGVPGSGVDLAETLTPDGQPAGDSQEVGVPAGESQIQVVAQTEAEEPPAEEPPAEEPPAEEPPAEVPSGPVFTLTFFAIDLNGAALLGACFAIDDGEPVCDDDQDGAVIIPNVPAGTRTLSEPRAPEGYAPYPDIQLEVTRDEQFSVPHNPGEAPPPETSTIGLVATDQDGNALPFACFELSNGAAACDDDGDGVTVFTDVEFGVYGVTETQAPEGFENADDLNIEVSGDENFQIAHQAVAEPTPEEPQEFTIGFVAVDANQNGLPFACYTLDGGDEQCDDDGDAIVTFENVSAGEHTLTETLPPDGYENVGGLDVNVDGDRNFAVRHQEAAAPEEPEETPTTAPEAGLTVGFVSVDPDDNGLPGACFQLDGGEEACDDDGDAEVTFTGVEPGPHTLNETRPPDGFESVGSIDLDLQNDGRFAIRHQPSEEEQLGELGELVATTRDQDGNELAEVCYQISTLGEQCDGDDPDNVMTQTEVEPGEYTIELVVPEGYDAVGDTTQTVNVEGGAVATVEFQVQPSEGPGIVVPPTEEGAGAIQAAATEEGFPILDACIAFEGPASGEVCDNQQGDDDPEQGVVLISNLPAGDYAVSMPNPPPGFDPAPPAPAVVSDGEVTQVILEVGAAEAEPTPTNTPEPEIGNLTIIKADPDGNLLEGACFQVGDSGEICDNGDGDTDGQGGVIRIVDLPAGDTTVTETVAPDGFLQADVVAVTIETGGEAEVQVVDQPAPPPVGSFRVVKREPGESRIGGACFTLVGADGAELGPWCDGGPEDLDDRTGVMEIPDIPVGDYIARETQAPEGYVTAADTPVTIAEGERTSITVINEPGTGSLAIAKTDGDGNAFAGACFAIGDSLVVCDNGEGDADPAEGLILVEGLPAADYIVGEQPVDGYVTPDSQQVTVASGKTAQAAFVNVPSVGSVVIQKTDETGNLLGGACFLIGDREICDNGDGDESGDAGVVQVSGVPAGTVEVAETVAPEGYTGGASQSVEVITGESTQLSFTNTRETGSIRITKTDEDGNLLAGACFLVGDREICDNGDGDESGDDGTVVVSGLPTGDVDVSESTAPDGYDLDSRAQTATVASGEEASVSFSNQRSTGTIRINKTDEDGNLLAGACFLVGDREICDNGDGDESGDDGTVVVSGIPTGDVDVSESTAPDGYNLDPQSQTATVATGEEASVSFSNQRSTGSVRITKTDEAGDPLAGACFLVGDREICDNGDGDESADDGTVVVSGLPIGDVEVSESTAPDGYDLDSQAQTATVASGEEASISFSNQRSTGSIRITKTDEAGDPLAGACFLVGDREVCDNGDGDESGDDGTIVVSGIPIGDVQVSESVAPAGYILSGDPQTVTVASNEDAAVSLSNQRAVGGISISKTDEDGNPLGAACFLVGGTEVCDNAEGDDNPAEGTVDVSGIATGQVEISESSAPDGYIPASDPQVVEVTEGGTATVAFSNTRATGSIRIAKTDEAGAALGGSCFTVADLAVCDNQDGDQDLAEGVIRLDGVPTGSYDVNETQAPVGYAPGDAQQTEITDGGIAELTFVNVRQVGSLQITKVDINDLQSAPIGGACFELQGAGTAFCDNDENDAEQGDGVIRVDNLPVGSFELVETQAPNGFAAGSNVAVEITSGEVTTVTVGNTRITGSIRILKVDAADGATSLAGACFSVDGGESICDNQTGDLDQTEGLVEIGNIAVGQHEVTETTAPAGFVAGSPASVDVPSGAAAEVTIVNTRAEGTLRIEKTDEETGEPLGGACFSIDGGEPVCDNDLNDADSADGVLEITTTPGERVVEETQAPEGYDALSEPQTVTVPDGDSVTVAFTNSQFTGSVRITKTDNATDDPLGGACFTVAGETSYGPVCDNGEGDADPAEGTILLQALDPDVYTITETTTPEGFTAPEGPVAEGVQVTGGAVTDVAVANDVVVESLLPPVQLGGVAISKVDDLGEPLGGACLTLTGESTIGPICDNDEADVDPDEGAILIEGVAPGTYLVDESTVPEGYSAGAPQQIAVAAGETTELELVNEPTEPVAGSLRARMLDSEGNLVGGACISTGTTTLCDNDPGDGDADPGEILLSGLIAGDYEVSETEPPAGFLAADPQQATIAGDQETVLEFTHEPAPVETGGLEFELKDPDGNPVEGACVALSSEDNQAQDLVYCDGGPEDQSADPGLLIVEGIPVGVYSVSQASVPGEESAQVAGVSFKMSVLQDGEVQGPQVPLVEKTVFVKPNIIVVVIIIIIIEPPQDGSLEIIKRAEDSNLLQPGACFEITGQGNTIEICDNDGVDANLTNGVIRFVNLAEGVYSITETQTPPGYDSAPDQDAIVVGGLITTITIKDPPTPEPIGDLTVLKVDAEGSLIPGTCFELRQGPDVVAGPLCDADDGADDGSMTFADLDAGDYILRETQAASDDYQPVPDQPVTVIAGEDTEFPVVNELKPGSILIVKLDDEGNGPLPGACFGLDRGDGIEYEVCDQQPGDGDFEEGIILINNVPAGEYDLIETVAPAGFEAGGSQQITVEPNQQLLLEIENEPYAPPADTGDLEVLKKDSKGDPLTGACFVLKQGAVIKVGQKCDADDGALDGTIEFTDVGVGLYALVETKKPSADYQLPPPKFVLVVKDQTTTVSVVNVLKPGRILVQKVNQLDHALANACFKVTPGVHPIKCTDGSGNVVFDNLKPGVYTVTETQAPYGYLAAPPVTNIVVKPGLTSPIKIVNQKAPPPPDAGSLKVIKFFCPLLGKAGDLSQVYDSSDPGPKTLAQTANCKKGDATFVLKPKSGGGDIISIKFATGPDGETHLTLPAGIYTLTEQKTKITVEVQVFVGQQTTVVVLNYVPPPKPAPVRINVFKYTCDPGFQGQYYLDFINGCGTYEALTNNVTFRISGAAILSKVTGDGGERGRTLFTQLPAGLYTLKEDVPPGAGTVYAWCGLAIEGSEYGAISNKISFPLSSGETMYCAFFNVPDEVTDTTGSIVVQKYSCELPQVKRPANFDWFAECGLQKIGAKFSLSQLVEGTYMPKATGVTDINGILKFNGLKPGTYRLQEVGADWCHAESDSVDVKGDVIVKAGKRSNVWIFNCVPTVRPPNTGAGTTAGVQQSAGIAIEESGSNAAMLIAWPMLAGGALAARRKMSLPRAA